MALSPLQPIDRHSLHCVAPHEAVHKPASFHALLIHHASTTFPSPQEHCITSDEALVIDEYSTNSIVIVGGGYIAVRVLGYVYDEEEGRGGTARDSKPMEGGKSGGGWREGTQGECGMKVGRDRACGRPTLSAPTASSSWGAATSRHLWLGMGVGEVGW